MNLQVTFNTQYMHCRLVGLSLDNFTNYNLHLHIMERGHIYCVVLYETV